MFIAFKYCYYTYMLGSRDNLAKDPPLVGVPGTMSKR
jgi:hypothetical protein